MPTSLLRLLFALLCVSLAAAACGGDDDDTSAGDIADDVAEGAGEVAEDAGDAIEDAGDAAEDAGDAIEDATDGSSEGPTGDDEVDDFIEDQRQTVEDAIESQGGGGATLTVGGETYTFDAVVCAFGPDEIGQEGAELVVTGITDGLQLYVSIDSFGHSVDLQDIEDFENQRVSLSALPFLNSEEFIQVDGKNVTAEASFIDDTNNGAEVDGTLEATCP
ncbi:MAG: hypothetical protein RIE08_08365 [Acidimicrobiales bacterium]